MWPPLCGQAGFHHDFGALQDPQSPLLVTLSRVLDYIEVRKDFPAWLPNSLFHLTRVSWSWVDWCYMRKGSHTMDV